MSASSFPALSSTDAPAMPAAADDTVSPSLAAAGALLQQAEGRLSLDPAGARADARVLIDAALPELDPEALGRAWRVVGLSHGHDSAPQEAVQALERARGKIGRASCRESF